MNKPLRTDLSYAVCSKEHQLILYRKNLQTGFDCPICTGKEKLKGGIQIINLNAYRALNFLRGMK